MNFDAVLRRYAEWILRRRVAVIVAALGISLFLAARVASLKLDMDPDLWTPQDHPYTQATKTLEQVFGGRNFVVIGVIPRTGDVYNPAVLAKIQRIQTGIERIPEAVRRNILSLAARKVKDIRGTPEGMDVRPLLATLPRTPDEIARLKAAVVANPIYLNALVATDGRAAAVVADFKLRKGEYSYTALYRAIRAVTDPEQDAHVDIRLSGMPIDLAWIEFHMAKMPLYFVVALCLIVAIQYWSFRSLQGMLLPIATALLSVLWGLGAMGLLGVHMDAMNINTPILIMAVAAGHAIQILKRYYEEYHRLAETQAAAAANRAAIVESLARVGPALLTAGLIAVATFLSLTAAEISVVRNFGLFAGLGILSAVILELSLMPALRSFMRPPRAAELQRERRDDALDRGLRRLADALVRGRAPWILAVGLVAALLASAGALKLRVDNSLKHYNKADSEVRRDDRVLNARLAGTSSVFFLVESAEPDRLKDPDTLRAIDALQTFLERQPHVGKTQSLADLIKRMHRALHADDAAYDTVPTRRDLIAQYLFLYSLAGDPQDFDNLVDRDYRRAALWVYLKNDSTAYAQQLYERAQPVIAREFPADVVVRLAGGLPQTIANNDAVTQGKLRNVIQMALIVFLLSSLALRSLVGGLFVTTPLILVTFANFGLMGWLGIPLDMGTASTVAMALGIGADYELYLLFRFREELRRDADIGRAVRDSLATSGKAILFVAFSIAGGYAVLLASDLGFYVRFAAMVIATMLVSAVSALIFLRAMMIVFKPRFIFGKTRALYQPTTAKEKM